jgi:hypothetical protein
MGSSLGAYWPPLGLLAEMSLQIGQGLATCVPGGRRGVTVQGEGKSFMAEPPVCTTHLPHPGVSEKTGQILNLHSNSAGSV